MLDQNELVRVDDSVVGGAIIGVAHPVVEAVDGDECWWTRLGTGLGEFFEEMLPDPLSDGGLLASQLDDVVETFGSCDGCDKLRDLVVRLEVLENGLI